MRALRCAPFALAIFSVFGFVFLKVLLLFGWILACVEVLRPRSGDGECIRSGPGRPFSGRPAPGGFCFSVSAHRLSLHFGFSNLPPLISSSIILAEPHHTYPRTPCKLGQKSRSACARMSSGWKPARIYFFSAFAFPPPGPGVSRAFGGASACHLAGLRRCLVGPPVGYWPVVGKRPEFGGSAPARQINDVRLPLGIPA